MAITGGQSRIYDLTVQNNHPNYKDREASTLENLDDNMIIIFCKTTDFIICFT